MKEVHEASPKRNEESSGLIQVLSRAPKHRFDCEVEPTSEITLHHG